MTRRQWFRTEKITESIILIDDRKESNIYLVKGSRKSLLIDTGWGIGDLPGVVREYTDKPLIVVNTHGHPDHAGGDYQFDEIYVPAEDISTIEECFSEEKRKFAIENVVSGPMPDGFSEADWICAKPGKLIPMDDNHVFDLGDRKIEVIFIPGHSPGSVALLDSSDRVLFTGDSVLEGDIWLYLDKSAPLDVYLSGMRKLDSFSGSFDMILPAHCRAPISRAIIGELIRGVEKILDGTLKGKPYRTFAGEGILQRFESCGVIYDESKLVSPIL